MSKNFISPVKDQTTKACASSYAYAAIGALESAYIRMNPNAKGITKFSEK